MSYAKVKEIFRREFELNNNLNMDSHIFAVIEELKFMFDIDTNRNEFLIRIDKKRVIDAVSRNSFIAYFLTIKPSQELLQKFEKDYPEFLI